MSAMEYKEELALVRQQNIDITNFENEMEDFKAKFGRNYRLASEKFRKAIDEIDKTIDHLLKTKDALLGSEIIFALPMTKLKLFPSRSSQETIQL